VIEDFRVLAAIYSATRIGEGDAEIEWTTTIRLD
jgi:hypothetical protein